MKVKSITLILISLFLICYVVFYVIKDIIFNNETSCESGSCVRFCSGSKPNASLNLIEKSPFVNLSSNYSVINYECEEKLDFEKIIKGWKFQEV